MRITLQNADNTQNEDNSSRSTRRSIKLERAEGGECTRRTTPMLRGVVSSQLGFQPTRLVPPGFAAVPMAGDGRGLVAMIFLIPPRPPPPPRLLHV